MDKRDNLNPLRYPTLGQVNLYFALAVVGSVVSGVTLRAKWGLPAALLTHVLLFVLLPALMAPAGAYRQIFRLRPVGSVTVAKSLLIGGFAWLTAQALGVVAYYVYSRLGGQPADPYQSLLGGDTSRWLLFLTVAVMPALTEEFAFRGLVLSGYARLGSRAAWVGAGLLFAALHLSALRLPALGLLGMVYAHAALRTGSLIPGMLMHLTNNTISLSYYFANPQPGATPSLTIPFSAVLYWTVAGLVALGPMLALLRTLEPGPDAPAPLDPEHVFSRWWPLLPAGVLVGSLMFYELTRQVQ